MKITISGKQIDLTDAIKDTINEKLDRLDHYLTENCEVKVTVKAKKNRQTVEVTIIPVNGAIIRAEDSEEDLYSAIDVVYDKLKGQLRKYKNKLQDRHQKHESIRYENIEEIDEVEETDDIKIERIKKFDLKPMSVDEAILQMELIGHEFYMFRNEDEEIAVVYKRHSGGYGILEQE
ncbi:MAG: ribosome-associated translation inhibitor RaiA [Peptostreptococcaceae bacterium]